MSTFTTSDMSRKSGDIIAEALRRPVTITQRNKPRLVVLNVEDYQRLLKRGDSRQAHAVAEMPEALFEEAVAALAAYERDDGQP